ncbi:MAG: NUDIX domain-containing protein [Bacteroidota bacterium]
MKVEDIIAHGRDYFLPNLSIDLTILGYCNNQLQVLLMKVGDKWMLPGGYIGLEESVDEAVKRILLERTDLRKPYFKFLSVFGHKDRKFATEFQQFFKKNNMLWKEDYWINNRFVTLAFYALVDMDTVNPAPGDFDDAVEWFPLNDLPPIWLDHKRIIQTARNRLKTDIKYDQITYNLLPQEFTMPQLHALHETILEEKLDRSRFQKNMLATELFERLPEVVKASPGRNPFQYRLKKE